MVDLQQMLAIMDIFIAMQVKFATNREHYFQHFLCKLDLVNSSLIFTQ